MVENTISWLAKHTDGIRIGANFIRRRTHDFYQPQGYREIKQQKVFIEQL